MQHQRLERFDRYPMKASERPTIMYEYYVSGSGLFPFDMLRFDSCWPATGGDAAYMADYMGERKMRSVRMRSYREPTIDRWSSFGWSVGNEKL